MNAPVQLFLIGDEATAPPYQVFWKVSKARKSDPVTSHIAADCVKPGRRELVYAIRWWVSKQSEPKSAFDIADAIYGPRWQHDTVRTCVSRAGLHAVDSKGRTKGGRPCLRYVLKDGA